MDLYLKEIESAVRPVISAIWHEHEDLAYRYNELGPLFKIVESKCNEAHQLGRDYFGIEAQNLVKLNEEAHLLKRRILARRFAVSALSGTLLQFAKQGISLVYGSPEGCPNGRFIGSQNLKTVIWQGRNQSMHWDEGARLSPRVRACFVRLCFEFGFIKFSGFQSANLGFEIIELLNWRSFDDFRDDLLSLGQME